MKVAKRLPYPGLRAFARDESDLFFGREGCVDAMVDRLAVTRFLAVLGPSGSGKSSLVRTGFEDALDLGLHPWAGSRWKIADLHPGGQPMRNLAAALLATRGASLSDATDIQLLTAFLGHGPRSIVEWVTGGNLPEGWNLLILVDQFEELFRYGDYAQREEAEAFVALLLESAAAPGVPIHVVATMRSEYLGACALISGLAERINAGLFLTPRMGREECREAIEGPAGVIGFRVEPALVNRLLNDLAGFAPWEGGERTDQAERLSRQADQLPVMQHVLNRLWVRADAEANGAFVDLKLADYQRIGGLSGALDAHGAEIMTALGASRTQRIEDVFRAMVSGTSVAEAVRRPCRMGELIEVANGARDDVVAIVEAFRAPGCNFMRTSAESLGDDVIVDISHESLIRQWTRLREWLEKEVRAILAWRRIVSAEERYQQHEGDLLTGIDLHSLAAWWESAHPTETWAARHGGKFDAARVFLEASRRAEAAEADAERRRQMRESRRLRVGIAALAIALAFAVGFGWKAHRSRQESLAINRQLELQARTLQATNNQLETERQKAEIARNDAVTEEHRTTAVLDDVSNLVHSDHYKGLVGVGEMQSELMTTLRQYQSDISKQHTDAIEPASVVRDEFRSANSFATLGDAQQAIDHFAKAYERGRKALEDLPTGSRPKEALEANFIEDAYYYAWSLLDVGEEKTAAKVRRDLEKLARLYEDHSTSALLLLEYGRYESLESRYYWDRNNFEAAHKHRFKQQELAARAVAMPNPTMDALRLEFAALEGLSSEAQGADRTARQDQACTLSERMIKKGPMDIRAITARVECLRDQAYRPLNRDKKDEKDFEAAAKLFQQAKDLILNILQLVPDHQALLLQAATVETDQADLWHQRGDEVNRKQALLDAKSHFYRALKDRTAFQSSTGQIKSLYQSFQSLDFPLDKELAFSKEQLHFYEDIAAAVEPTRKAFPKSPGFAYVANDASISIAKLLSKDPKRRQEAAQRFTESIDSLNRLGGIGQMKRFSEDFARYCGTYSQRAELYAATGQLDLMLNDINQVKKTCGPALDKYPFDFYLRWRMKNNSKLAAQALFDMHRYKDALPYLEDASHWGIADGSKLLARMYEGGFGVPRDEQKAKHLKALALGQATYSFTVLADFNGAKSQTTFYAFEWPPEYPFAGIDDQVKWLKEARGGTVASKVTDALRNAQKLMRDSKVSFPEICAYALDKDQSNVVKAAREKYSLESTWENLDWLRNTANKHYEALVKAKKDVEASALQKELVEKAEKRIKEVPNADSYREVWLILTDQGDHLKSGGQPGAQQVFERSLELAELLPTDKPEDLYKRFVSFERLGDLESAIKHDENARNWFSKQVEAARRRFTLDPTVDTLASVKSATKRLCDVLLKLKQQPQADEAQKALVETAENLLKKKPNVDAYRAAWTIVVDQGDRLKSNGQPGVPQIFARGVELAELLPGDNADDQYKRLVSYERLGDQESAGKNDENARRWYLKEVEAARQGYRLEATADKLALLRNSTNRLYETLVNLKQQPQGKVFLDTLRTSAADLVARIQSQSSDASREASSVYAAFQEATAVYAGLADKISAAGDAAQARLDLTRAQSTAQLLPNDTPDGAFGRSQSFETLGDSFLKNASPAEARAAYSDASLSLQRYCAFLTASPAKHATKDTATLTSHYGSLSWLFLLAGNLPKSMEAAHHGLDLEPTASWIEANLAHGLLLSGKREEAIEHYLKAKDGTVNNKSIVDATAEDFVKLRSLGFNDPAMDEILKRMAAK